MSVKIGVVLFPGTNCEQDIAWAVERLGAESVVCWHGEATVHDSDAVVIPGGTAAPLSDDTVPQQIGRTGSEDDADAIGGRGVSGA